MKRLSVRKTDTLGSPFEVASQLSHCTGFVFMDSSGNLPINYHKPLSIIGINPLQTFRGESCAFTGLSELLEGYEIQNDVPSYIPQGGLFGWIDYESQYCFGFFEDCLVYDHAENHWYEFGDVLSHCLPAKPSDLDVGVFHQHMDKASYIEKVRRIQEYIKAGDIYQVNLAQKFSTQAFRGDFFQLYQTLRSSAPAPMAAYFSLEGREVLSSSPETFLSFIGNHVTTRPIKGTRPRYEDSRMDKQAAEDLKSSVKESAELVMITDLQRNDLGQVCEFGSVQVEEMLKLEKLEHVYHLVSKITGTVRKDLNHFDVIRACFPGGSITGAPKKRAMEIISELEEEKRGLYTGAIGYVGLGGASQFSIVIRTLVKESDTLHYHVGAGIVADSDAEAEYNETLHKAKGIQLACARHSMLGE